MGNLFQGIFGGSKSKQQSTSQSTSQNQSASWNDAYPFLKEEYSPSVEHGLTAQDFISSLLGLNGNPAANDAFNHYKDSSGYDFIMDSGSKAIDNNAASRGMFNSGATAKALTKFGQGTAAQFYNNYLDRLLGLSGQGMAAGSMLANAGQRSTSSGTSMSTGQSTGKSSSKPGLSAMLGQAAASAAAGG